MIFSKISKYENKNSEINNKTKNVLLFKEQFKYLKTAFFYHLVTSVRSYVILLVAFIIGLNLIIHIYTNRALYTSEILSFMDFIHIFTTTTSFLLTQIPSNNSYVEYGKLPDFLFPYLGINSSLVFKTLSSFGGMVFFGLLACKLGITAYDTYTYSVEASNILNLLSSNEIDFLNTEFKTLSNFNMSASKLISEQCFLTPAESELIVRFCLHNKRFFGKIPLDLPNSL